MEDVAEGQYMVVQDRSEDCNDAMLLRVGVQRKDVEDALYLSL